ncbi:MAG: prepilin-type N-terminal cleavage/methylation domain-containing protein [Rubrivivax sp.]|jgi:type IV pilus assembly protein PilE|nr:prepilin-type N-terminal cleavage/methylation domain-containing protein [Rubrivivax sp.]
MAHPGAHPGSTRRAGSEGGGGGGFTLVELLIALVVLGILASVALPSFLDSVRKGRRSEAFAALNAVQQAQERWRANNPSYTTDLSAAGLNLPTSSSGGRYSIAVNAADASGYTVTATGNGSQAEDGSCAKLAVQAAGGNIRYGSGTSGGSVVFSDNDRCWAR